MIENEKVCNYYDKSHYCRWLERIKQDEKHMEKIIGKVYIFSKESFDKCLVRLSI